MIGVATPGGDHQHQHEVEGQIIMIVCYAATIMCVVLTAMFSPRSLVSGWYRFLAASRSFLSWLLQKLQQADNKQDDGDEYEASDERIKRKQKVVLCLCGGGVRGVMSAMIIERLDQIAQSRHGLRLWDIIDEAIGTSTGSMIAVLLAIGTEPSEIVSLYKTEVQKIFPVSFTSSVKQIVEPKYEEEKHRHEMAEKYLGDRKLNDLSVYPARLRPTLLTFELATRQTRPFSSKADVRMADALLAATAAPTFFPAHLIEGNYYCDGGLTENHPGLQVIEQQDDVYCVVTVGTGEPDPDTEHLAKAGLVKWGKEVADVIIDGGERIVKKLLSARFDEDHNFHFNPELPKKGKIDIDDAKTVPVMIPIAEKFISTQEAQLVKAVDAMHAGMKLKGKQDFIKQQILQHRHLKKGRRGPGYSASSASPGSSKNTSKSSSPATTPSTSSVGSASKSTLSSSSSSSSPKKHRGKTDGKK